MSDGQKTFWLSAAFVVVIAIGGVTLWQIMNGPTRGDLAALNAKIEVANANLVQVRKATASGALATGLAELQDNIKGTNKALAAIQRTIAAGNVRDRLDRLEKNVKAIDASLSKLQHSQAAADVGGKVAALSADIKSLSETTSQLGAKLADTKSAIAAIKDAVPKQNLADRIKGVTDQIDQLGASLKSTDATLAAIKKAMPKQSLADQIDPLNDKIKALSDNLVDIQKSTSLDGIKKQLAALNGKLESTSKAVASNNQEDTAALKAEVAKLRTSVADTAALRAKLADDVAKLQAAAKPQPKEAVVFYLHMPNEKNLPQKIASVQPLDIQFAKIGSTDDNGQAAIIIPKLKTLIEGRKDCTISVAGYADTLGSDNLNLKISQKRAQNIAQKIKAAIPDVTVNVAAWGERRLQTWTPDATADEANRRVDISLNCKG